MFSSIYEKIVFLEKAHQSIREFFTRQKFQEVFTPLLLKAPIPEPYIQALPVGEKGWLRPSPEVHMKQLLAKDKRLRSIFQIGPCFRDDEWGAYHRYEFTMIEWYEVGKNYLDIQQTTRELINFLALSLGFSQITEWVYISLEQAFDQFTQYSLQEAIGKGYFEEILVTQIEPALTRYPAVFLYGYPASMAALAEIDLHDPTKSQRWELYLQGIEVANAYTELTCATEQIKRFHEWNQQRQNQDFPIYPIHSTFLEAVQDLPPCAGCAMGLERALMGLTGMRDISLFRLFPDEPRSFTPV